MTLMAPLSSRKVRRQRGEDAETVSFRAARLQRTQLLQVLHVIIQEALMRRYRLLGALVKLALALVFEPRHGFEVCLPMLGQIGRVSIDQDQPLHARHDLVRLAVHRREQRAVAIAGGKGDLIGHARVGDGRGRDRGGASLPRMAIGQHPGACISSRKWRIHQLAVRVEEAQRAQLCLASRVGGFQMGGELAAAARRDPAAPHRDVSHLAQHLAQQQDSQQQDETEDGHRDLQQNVHGERAPRPMLSSTCAPRRVKRAA